MADRDASALPIGAAARRSGVNIETIRFYERSGLLGPAPRTAGGHRMYDAGAVKRLAFVRRARELGFTLAQVRGLLALAGEEEASCARVEPWPARISTRCAGASTTSRAWRRCWPTWWRAAPAARYPTARSSKRCSTAPAQPKKNPPNR